MYALNIDKETNRVLSACVILENGNYDGMPIVDTLPNGDITDYLYIVGEYIYSPLPKPEPTPTITEAERLEALEMAIAELAGEIYNG